MTHTSPQAPLVSVVTPVLDRVGTIERCLQSVASQTYPALEHIIVDGGSTDGTLSVIRSTTTGHQRTVISEPDNGMYEAINKGFGVAKGEILTYLNSDDLFMPWTVEVAVAQLQRTGADIVYGDLAVLVAGDPPGFFPQFYRPFDFNYYTHFATLGQPTVFWRHEIARATGSFDTTYKLIGDCEYWLRAAQAGARFHHIEEILAVQVEHGETLRATHPEALQNEFIRLRAKFAQAAGPARGRLSHALKRRLRWRFMQLAFLREATRPTPTRWLRFIRFLSEHGVATRRRGILWYLLPGVLRPDGAALLDVEAFEHALTRKLSQSA